MNGVWNARRSGDRLLRIMLLLMLGCASGCSSDEATQAPPGATPPAPTRAENSDPPELEASVELLAAQTAFRTMTTQNVTPAEWEAAHQKLQQIGPPALPVLIEGLQSSEQVRREMASTVLAWFGVDAESAADALIAALNDESNFVRANVATALLQMPDHVDRVVPVLTEFLQSDDKDLKRMAATNLAAIEADKARPLLPQLTASLDDDDREVVYYATQLLGRIGPEAAAALPKLRALDTADDAELQSAVEAAILQIDSESQTP